ncbi:MAG: hypothetical protein HC912_01230 [Saprospiraceae bacterium]|nr:hypothetical protein [Saprospiraceae bacterium]
MRDLLFKIININQMGKKNIVLFFLIFIFFSTHLFPQTTLIIKNAENAQLIGKSIAYLEDKTSELSLEDILKPEYQEQFVQGKNDFLKFSETNQPHWFKISVANYSGEDLFLELGVYAYDFLDLYVPDSLRNYTNPPLLSGTERGYKANFLSPIRFWLPLNKKHEQQTKIFYLRIYKPNYSFNIAFFLGNRDALHAKKSYQYAFNMTFFGIFVIVFMYNLFVYLSTKEKIYLVYLAHILVSIPGYLNSAYTSILSFISFGLLSDTWGFHNIIFLTGPITTLVIIFGIQYLKVRQNLRWAYWGFLLFLLVNGITIPMIDLVVGTNTTILRVFGLTNLALAIFVILVSFLVWLKKDKSALYYLLGWGCYFLIQQTYFMAFVYGILPVNIFTENALLLGPIFEIWFFSLALGNRINLLRDENEKILREQSKVLEEKIRLRTQELQNALEETQVMNKELLQTQKELEAQKEFMADKNKKLEQVNNQINLSIKSAKTIQTAILPLNEKLGDVFQDYFIINRPKDVVSGDFYWLNVLEGK